MVGLLMPKVLLDFKKDLLMKELITVKVMFAFLMAAVSSLYPFLTIHLKSLGITAAETAVIYSLLPIIAFLAPPITGVIADKFGHLKIIFSVMCLLTLIIGDSLMFVPPTRVKQPYASTISWQLRCSKKEFAAQFQTFNEPCNLKNSEYGINVSFTITQCARRCFDGSNTLIQPCFVGVQELCVSETLDSKNTSTMSFRQLIPSNLQKTQLMNETLFSFSSLNISNSLYGGLSCGPVGDTNCQVTCYGTLASSQLCENIEENNELTFWIYLVIRIALSIVSSSVFVLFESVTLEVLKPFGADYGLQKLWGAVAACIFSPLTGFLIDYMSIGKDYIDFSVSFYIYTACRLLMAIIIPFLPMEFKLPAQAIRKDIKTLLKNVTFDVFILMMFLTGAFWGYLEGFLFWFLQELDATQSLMGLTVTVGGVASLPILILSGVILRKFGHVNVMVVGLVVYGIRFLGYSVIWNPYYVLPFEALEAFTSMLQLVAAVTYTAKLAPPSILTSAQGIMVGVHYGIGRGAGSLIGGYLMSFLGTRTSFQIMGVASIIVGIIYLVVYHCFLKKRTQDLGYQEPEEKEVNVNEKTKVDVPKSDTSDTIEKGNILKTSLQNNVELKALNNEQQNAVSASELEPCAMDKPTKDLKIDDKSHETINSEHEINAEGTTEQLNVTEIENSNDVNDEKEPSDGVANKGFEPDDTKTVS